MEHTGGTILNSLYKIQTEFVTVAHSFKILWRKSLQIHLNRNELSRYRIIQIGSTR